MHAACCTFTQRLVANDYSSHAPQNVCAEVELCAKFKNEFFDRLGPMGGGEAREANESIVCKNFMWKAAKAQ